MHSRFGEGYLGDEWNDADEIGIDCLDDEIPDHLHEVFGPFLGSVDQLIEIGPGGGRFTRLLLGHCRELLALDTSENMLSLVTARFPDRNVVALKFDSRNIEAADASIDAAFSYDVFVHLSHWEIFNLLAELNRVCRDGAPVVIHHGNSLSELGWKRFLSDVPEQLGRHPYWGAFTFMTPRMFRDLAERAGFHVEACDIDVVRRDAITFLRAQAPRPDGSL